MTILQQAQLSITAKISIRSAQSRKYYERSFDFETLSFDKSKSACSVKFNVSCIQKLENFFNEYFCEEYYVEIPAGKLFFTFRNMTMGKDSNVEFHVFKEEKIAYPEKVKV